MTIETYPEMNAKIVEILQRDKDNPLLFYAAQRIEELEAEVEQLQRELHDEQIRCDEWEKMYNQAIAGTNLRQCKVCKAMIVDPPSALSACLPEPDCERTRSGRHRQALPCGHPREAATSEAQEVQ